MWRCLRTSSSSPASTRSSSGSATLLTGQPEEFPMKIAILPGDGIGTEIVAEAVKVLKALDLRFEMEHADVGGAAYERHGHPLPDSTLALAKSADAVLFGAVGDWKYDKLE